MTFSIGRHVISFGRNTFEGRAGIVRTHRMTARYIGRRFVWVTVR